MTQSSFTKPQQTFLARAAIFEWMGAYETTDGVPLSTVLEEVEPGFEESVVLTHLGIDDDILDAYWLARTDLEKAREVMEEAAAFAHLTNELVKRFPQSSRTQLQKSARALVADPATRHTAAVASGVYELLRKGQPLAKLREGE